MHRGAAGGVVQQGEQLFAERIAIDVRIRKDHSGTGVGKQAGVGGLMVGRGKGVTERG